MLKKDITKTFRIILFRVSETLLTALCALDIYFVNHGPISGRHLLALNWIARWSIWKNVSPRAGRGIDRCSLTDFGGFACTCPARINSNRSRHAPDIARPDTVAYGTGGVRRLFLSVHRSCSVRDFAKLYFWFSKKIDVGGVSDKSR